MASTIWRGYITFGFISIPVRLFRAARAERVSLRQVSRSQKAPARPEANEDSAPVVSFVRQPERSLKRVAFANEREEDAQPVIAPVRQALVSRDTGEVVAKEALARGYEYKKDSFVVIEPDELKSLAAETSAEMEILEFVHLAEIDPVYFETSYYVRPEEAGAKAYALLFHALQTTGLVAVARLAMHGREHVLVLRPGKSGLISHTMFFSSEVRAEEEYAADISALVPRELDLAETLIHSLAASFEPEKYKDGYREKLEAMIAAKVEGKPVETKARPASAGAVIDIAEALKKSLANLKKPPSSDQELARAPEEIPPAVSKKPASPKKRSAR